MPLMIGLIHISNLKWLNLSAAPTFAIMALLTNVFGDGSHGADQLTRMTLMYLLMAAFRSTPWLRRIVDQRSGTSSGQGRALCSRIPALPETFPPPSMKSMCVQGGSQAVARQDSGAARQPALPDT